MLTIPLSSPAKGRILAVLVLAFGIVLSTFANAQPGAIGALRVERVEAETEVIEMTSVLREAERRQARALERVEGLRGRDRDADLREALAAAHVAAEVVASRDADFRAARVRYAEATAALVRALRVERARLEQGLGDSGGRGRDIVSALDAIDEEIAALTGPVSPHLPVPIEEILRGAPDDPEVALGALAELRDAETRIEMQLEELRAQLRDAEASARVLEATRFFSREESLLDDDGFGRIGVRSASRSGASDAPETNAGGARDDADDAAAPDDGPMDGGPVGAPDFGAPTAEPGSEADEGGMGAGGGEALPSLPPTLGVVLTPGGAGGHATSVGTRPGLDPALGGAVEDHRRGRRRDPRELRALELRLEQELDEVRQQRERLARMLETLN